MKIILDIKLTKDESKLIKIKNLYCINNEPFWLLDLNTEKLGLQIWTYTNPIEWFETGKEYLKREQQIIKDLRKRRRKEKK